MKDSELGGLAVGMLAGAAVVAGVCLMTQDKRKMRRMARKFACGCEQAISDVEQVICHCMK